VNNDNSIPGTHRENPTFRVFVLYKNGPATATLTIHKDDCHSFHELAVDIIMTKKNANPDSLIYLANSNILLDPHSIATIRELPAKEPKDW
jgi:hypothetical protein